LSAKSSDFYRRQYTDVGDKVAIKSKIGDKTAINLKNGDKSGDKP